MGRCSRQGRMGWDDQQRRGEDLRKREGERVCELNGSAI